MKFNWFVITYICMAVITQQASFGWWMANFYEKFPTLRSEEHCYEDAGAGAVWSVFAGVVWPVGLPATYATTGFAYHGWMSLAQCKEGAKLNE